MVKRNKSKWKMELKKWQGVKNNKITKMVKIKENNKMNKEKN